MNKRSIIKTLHKDLHFLQKEFGLLSIGLFGSYAKDLQKNIVILIF